MKRNVYVFAGEGYMVRESLARLRASLDIQMEELNVTVFSEMPSADQLIETCAAVPFLSPVRLVAVRDCTALTAAGNKDEAKKIADYLERLPDTTVLALCVAEALDKRRILYKRAAELGTVREFPAQLRSASIRSGAAKAGRKLARAARSSLSIWWGAIITAGNEVINWRCKRRQRDYGGACECCVSRSLEYNVFEIHRLFVNAGQRAVHAG